MDNVFVCLKAVAFRSVLSVLVADVEGMATKGLHSLLEGFYHSLQGLSFGFFDSDGITILVSNCLPLEMFHKIIGVIWRGYSMVLYLQFLHAGIY